MKHSPLISLIYFIHYFFFFLFKQLRSLLLGRIYELLQGWAKQL